MERALGRKDPPCTPATKRTDREGWIIGRGEEGVFWVIELVKSTGKKLNWGHDLLKFHKLVIAPFIVLQCIALYKFC